MPQHQIRLFQELQALKLVHDGVRMGNESPALDQKRAVRLHKIDLA